MTPLSIAGFGIGALALAAGVTGGVLILTTSGPLAGQQGDENATATTAPPETPTPVEPTASPTAVESRLAQVVAERADTSDWELFVSEEAGFSILVPPGFEVLELKWGPFLDSDQEPPLQIFVQRPAAGDPSQVEGQPPPEGLIVTGAVILTFLFEFGDPANFPNVSTSDTASLVVLSMEVEIREFTYEEGATKVAVGVNIPLGEGLILHLGGLVGGSADDDIRLLVGILTSLELLP